LTAHRVVIGAVAVLVVLCVAARFVHLERHWYFHDEATTSLYLSGHTWSDFERKAAARTLRVADLRRYQQVGSSGSAIAAIRNEARGNPQHPPLFYAVARVWAAVAGSSIASLRALAALFGLLALPCVFWLGRELFESSLPAWIAVGLTAISPFQILYSQEAREYTLWAATTALACAALLYALRIGTRAAWAVYVLGLVLALYTFPLSSFVFAAQVAYVAIRARHALRSFLIAAGVALIAWLPWLFVAARHRSAFRAGTDWTRETIPFVDLLKGWLVALGVNVVDKRGDTALSPSVSLLLAAVVLVQLAALVFLWLRGPKRAALFITLVFAASFLSLALADLARGGVRSIVPRFIVPALLALTLSLAYLLARGLRSRAPAARIGSVALVAGVIACSVGSYVHEAGARVWWNQDDGAAPASRSVADVLNASSRPFLLATGGGALLELTNYLRPQTRVRLVLNGKPPSTPVGTGDVFAYGSPATPTAADRLRRLLESLRERGAEVTEVDVEPACCGADIRHQPRQFWRVSH
jgi:uncharacterized membrane protein